MTEDFNFDLFRKGVFGLNKNLENVGGIFHKNIDFLASDLPIERKKIGVDKMAIEISYNLEGFKNSYDDFEILYDEVDNAIKSNNENKEEYKDFMAHVNDTFPKYISELNQSLESMDSIEIKTDNFNTVMADVNKIVILIVGTFKKFLKLSNQYLS